MFTAANVARHLQAAGFTVKSTSESDDSVDGEVAIDDLVSVQVGGSYLIVNKWVDNREAMRYWPTRRSVANVIADLREAIAYVG